MCSAALTFFPALNGRNLRKSYFLIKNNAASGSSERQSISLFKLYTGLCCGALTRHRRRTSIQQKSKFPARGVRVSTSVNSSRYAKTQMAHTQRACFFQQLICILKRRSGAHLFENAEHAPRADKKNKESRVSASSSVAFARRSLAS
jgi:hypothetical protein